MILTQSLLPPQYVPGTRVIVRASSHTQMSHPSRADIVACGCVLLRFMPLCIYVKVQGATENFLQKDVAMHTEDAELAGVLAITPTKRLWRFASKHFAKGVHVQRYQVPLLPRETMHIAWHTRQYCRARHGGPLEVPQALERGITVVGALCDSFAAPEAEQFVELRLARPQDPGSRSATKDSTGPRATLQ